MSENNKLVIVLGSVHYLYPYRAYLKSKGFSKFVELGTTVGPKNYHARTDSREPDLILFTGGGDISPALYKEQYLNVSFSVERDIWESDWFDYAVRTKTPMLGTCRGMQMFCVQTGGKLLKNVTNHMIGHRVFVTSEIQSIPQSFKVNSIHHQMCLPWPGTFKLLAYADNHSSFMEPAYYIAKLPKQKDHAVEPEALYFPEVNALGFQWHPEMMPLESESHEFVISCVDRFLKLGE